MSSYQRQQQQPSRRASFSFAISFILLWLGTNCLIYHRLQRDEPVSSAEAIMLGSRNFDRHFDTTYEYPTVPLSCSSYGGPDDEAANEMSYWKDIPSDSSFVSPFYDPGKYLTFEPDIGGFNNMRMSYETIILLAHSMGRTLVLPPKQKVYLLSKGSPQFSINDFVPLNQMINEFEGLNTITMEEFLKRKAITGQLTNITDGKVLRPPENRTNWDGQKLKPLWKYMRAVGPFPKGWEDPTKSFAAIPSSKGEAAEKELQKAFDEIIASGVIPDPLVDYVDEPVPVDGSMKDRMREMLGKRTSINIYDSKLQNEELLHFRVEVGDARMLTHFYSFLFFQNWRQDLWSKRAIRDHFRFIDSIMCAGARIVKAVRDRARSQSPSNKDGVYDSMHIRRGDFQFKKLIVSDINKLYNQSKDELEEGATLYIATDEKEKDFFNPLKDHYNITFLDDYLDLVDNVSPNFYGFLDQLVASKSRTFFGTWWSTYSGYINRIRGYHSVNNKQEGYELGHLQSYYFLPEDKKFQMTKYHAVKEPLYMREFPTGWRDIEKGIGELKSGSAEKRSSNSKVFDTIK